MSIRTDYGNRNVSAPTPGAAEPSPGSQNKSAGIHGQTYISPPVEGDSAATILADALASLAAFRSQHGKIDVDTMLVQLAVGMRNTEATSQESKIRNEREAKLGQMRDKDAKLGEAADKLREAEQRKSGGDVLANVKLAFEWIGVAVAFATAAAMIMTGAGAVVGGLLLAAAFTTLMMSIDSTVSHATDLGIAGNIAKDVGNDAEQVAQADMGFKIGLAVLGVGFSLAAGGVSVAGAARAAVDAGSTTFSAARAAGDAVMKSVGKSVAAARDAFLSATAAAGEGVKQGVKVAQRAVVITDAVAQFGSAGLEVARSSISYEESELRAGAKVLEAETKSKDALLQSLDDMIDQAMARLMASSDRFSQILDEISSALSDRNASLNRVRFAG